MEKEREWNTVERREWGIEGVFEKMAEK